MQKSLAITLSVLGLLISCIVHAQDAEQKAPPEQPPTRFEFEISNETTFVTEPKTESGFVDLAAAIDQHFSKGITPETNAAIPIYHAFGRIVHGREMSDRFYKQLGMAKPEDTTPKFESYFHYYRRLGGIENQDSLQQQLDRALNRPWKSGDCPAVLKWVSAETRYLHQVALGVKRPHYYLPVAVAQDDPANGQQLMAVLLPGVQISPDLGRAFAARAMLQLGEDQIEAAWQDAVTTMRLGRHIANGPFLIEGLVGIAIENMGIDAAIQVIGSGHLDKETTEHYLADLDSLPPRGLFVDKLNISERLMFVDLVNIVANGNDKTREVLNLEAGLGQIQTFLSQNWLASCDYNEALRVGHKWYDRYVEAMQIISPTKRQAAFDELGKELETMKASLTVASILASLFQTENRAKTIGEKVGQTIATGSMPQFGVLHIVEDRARQRHTNLRTAIILQAYHAEHGEYPDSLAGLVPDELPEVPQDIFADAPLRYGKTGEGFVLYSAEVGDLVVEKRAKPDVP